MTPPDLRSMQFGTQTPTSLAITHKVEAMSTMEPCLLADQSHLLQFQLEPVTHSLVGREPQPERLLASQAAVTHLLTPAALPCMPFGRQTATQLPITNKVGLMLLTAPCLLAELFLLLRFQPGPVTHFLVGLEPLMVRLLALLMVDMHQMTQQDSIFTPFGVQTHSM